MGNRLVSAAAIVVIAAAGCSSSHALLGTHDVQVRINGQDAGRHLAECIQTQRLWSIKTLQDDPGLTAQFRTDVPVVAKSVQINNLGGFTGTFWEHTTGEAQARFEDGTITITGTAEGFFHDDPHERTSAPFEITTDC
jgi:hypothetical protein